MHILFVTGEFPPQQGGVGAYTAELARALVKEGVDVSIVTSRTGSAPTDGAYSDQPEGLTVHSVIDRWDPCIWSRINGLASDLQADWVHVQYQTAAFNMNPAGKNQRDLTHSSFQGLQRL